MTPRVITKALALAKLAGDVTKSGRDWRCKCPVCKGHGLLIIDGDKGHPVVNCKSNGCDWRKILAALGATTAITTDTTVDDLAKRRADKDRAKREDIARTIWWAAQAGAGTRAESYLQARSITIPIPPTIRFHATLLHNPTGLKLPALVAAVQSLDGRISGVQRIYLSEDGRAKAPIGDPKMSLGTIAGGAVRLAAAREEIAVGEGLETCLSYQQATGTPSWAALGTAGMRAVMLPPLPRAALVYVLADADEAGETAALAAAERFHRDGRTVKIARPISGKDFNDALRGLSHAG